MTKSALAVFRLFISPFVRSIIGSRRNVEDHLLILPDFSFEDINYIY